MEVMMSGGDSSKAKVVKVFTVNDFLKAETPGAFKQMAEVMRIPVVETARGLEARVGDTIFSLRRGDSGVAISINYPERMKRKRIKR